MSGEFVAVEDDELVDGLCVHEVDVMFLVMCFLSFLVAFLFLFLAGGKAVIGLCYFFFAVSLIGSFFRNVGIGLCVSASGRNVRTDSVPHGGGCKCARQTPSRQ